MAGASIETTLELMASSLRDVKGRIHTLFGQKRVAASAGQFLDGLLGNEPRKTGWMRAEAAGKDKGWEIVADEPKEGRIEAVDRSLLFGFKDEVIIRIGASDGGVRVDVRSRSRIGRIDRGVNAKRIRSFLAALKERAG